MPQVTRVLAPRSLPGAMRIAAAALAVALAWPASAELWVWVDDTGRAHFANHQVDERYKLFFKGPTNLDIKPAPPEPTPEAGVSAVRIADRAQGHPNLARYRRLIEQHARARKLDPALVKALIAVESGYDPAAVSPKGAIGLMQVIPGTAARYGLASDAKRSIEQKLTDPATNVSIGTRYLADLMVRYDADVRLALAAYNAGEGAVDRYDRQVPPYPETQAYVVLVDEVRTLFTPPPPPPPPPRPPSRVIVPKPGGGSTAPK